MSTTAKTTQGIVAVFEYLDDFCKAIERIDERSDFQGHEAVSPTSYHELMHLAEVRYGVSQVRWFTLTGGLTGMVTGFALPLLCDWDWPIVVGGKTPGIYSLPAYFVFSFELMVLFGALCTIAGMLFMGRLPNPRNTVYDVRATDDRFAIFVPGVRTDGEQAKLLKECGAQEIYSTT